MLSLLIPDVEQVKRWLDQEGIQHYVCDHCHGLHLSELQTREGVLDARLFVEADRIFVSTEFELRPSMLPLDLANSSVMNMQFPLIKIFVDVNDEVMPQLVACGLLLSRQGLTAEQFADFVQAIVGETVELLEQCQRDNWLAWPEGSEASSEPRALH